VKFKKLGFSAPLRKAAEIVRREQASN